MIDGTPVEPLSQSQTWEEETIIIPILGIQGHARLSPPPPPPRKKSPVTIFCFAHIARKFSHLRDCAWPSRAAYANRRLIADPVRRSVVQGSYAVVDREEKKSALSLRNYPQLESLSCTSISLDFPSTLLWMTSFSVRLSRQSLSLSRRPPGVTHHALTHSVTLSSQARSSSQFHSFWKGSRKERPMSNPRTNCSLHESIISCAYSKPTPSTRRSARPPPTPRNKQTFLKILALCRETHQLWIKQRATVRRLHHEESRQERAGNKSRAVADRFDTEDWRRHLHACMHAYRRAVFFFSKAVETGKNLSSLVLLPWELKMAASIGVFDPLTVALSLWTNREEEKDEAWETTTVAWLAGTAAIAARERRNQGCFLKLWALPRCCSGMFFSPVFVDFASLRIEEHSQICGPHWIPSVEKRLVLKNASGSNSEHFSTQAYGGPALSDQFSPRCCSRRFLGFSLYWSTGKFKKKRSSLLEVTILLRFRLYKRKIVVFQLSMEQCFPLSPQRWRREEKQGALPLWRVVV